MASDRHYDIDLSRAQFGDRYLCRDGRRAVFLSLWGNPPQEARMYHDRHGIVFHQLDGRVHPGEDTYSDITTPCRADGFEPMQTQADFLRSQIAATEEMLALCGEPPARPGDLLQQASLQSRLEVLQELLADEEGKEAAL